MSMNLICRFTYQNVKLLLNYCKLFSAIEPYLLSFQMSPIENVVPNLEHHADPMKIKTIQDRSRDFFGVQLEVSGLSTNLIVESFYFVHKRWQCLIFKHYIRIEWKAEPFFTLDSSFTEGYRSFNIFWKLIKHLS